MARFSVLHLQRYKLKLEKIKNSHCEERSDVATDAAEREQRTSLLVLCRAARRKHYPCGGVKLGFDLEF